MCFNLRCGILLTSVVEVTNNFVGSLIVGAVGFGKIYRITFSDGTITVVKRNSPRSQQGLAEFENEIMKLGY